MHHLFLCVCVCFFPPNQTNNSYMTVLDTGFVPDKKKTKIQGEIQHRPIDGKVISCERSTKISPI